MPSSLIEAILGTDDTDVIGDEFLSNEPLDNETINHGNGVVQEFRNGIERWYKDGELHRDGDQPAIIYDDGSRYWYQHGQVHRDADKPAVICADGYQAWYKADKRHRDGDKPARIWPNDKVEYWVNDERAK